MRIVAIHKDMTYEYCEIDEDMKMAQPLYKCGDTNISFINEFGLL